MYGWLVDKESEFVGFGLVCMCGYVQLWEERRDGLGLALFGDREINKRCCTFAVC